MNVGTILKHISEFDLDNYVLQIPSFICFWNDSTFVINHMLWQLEIHAKSIIEHINEDTQYKIFGCTQSLKLKACFPCSNQISVLKVFFLSIPCKNIWLHLVFGKAIHCFHSQCFQKSLCCVLIQLKVSFKNIGC